MDHNKRTILTSSNKLKLKEINYFLNKWDNIYNELEAITTKEKETKGILKDDLKQLHFIREVITHYHGEITPEKVIRKRLDYYKAQMKIRHLSDIDSEITMDLIRLLEEIEKIK